MAILAYALSPIDLIPDFIPVIGYFDDLVLVPFGLILLIKIVPQDLLDEYRTKAEQSDFVIEKNWITAALIVALWVGGMAVTWYVLRRFRSIGHR